MDSPLFPLFYWAYLLSGGARSASGEATAWWRGASARDDAAGGLAEGTSWWTARVPVQAGVHHVTVTAVHGAGRFDSASSRLLYEGGAVGLD